MSNSEHRIEANDRTIFQVLDSRKYSVDFFQREYSWGEKHMKQLVEDLSAAFLANYNAGHSRSEVENYNSYYLGPYVLSSKDGMLSIIDGQQRLTSLTLFMIFLNHLGEKFGSNEKVESMIFSEKFGSKSFNITVEERITCLDALFKNGDYEPVDGDDESTKNMAARYKDIEGVFPEEIGAKAYSYFIDWLKERVVLVEIVAHSDDNAYTIFETMNDRGLNLTPTEMLKGYLLSRLESNKQRETTNNLWKKAMKDLHEYKDDEDQRFMQAWLRGQYAETIRGSHKGSINEDFEKIGTRFHGWFRENLSLMSLTSNSAEGFSNFLQQDFKFYLLAYLRMKKAEWEFIKPLENVYYAGCWGIADSLAYQLLLAPLCLSDSQEIIDAKMNTVAKFIETFTVRRSINFRNFSASSIRYTMCLLTKEIRRKSLDDLHSILALKLDEMEETWDGMKRFSRHGTNSRFIKFLLSRISGYIDEQSGLSSNFDDYQFPEGKPMEIEHIWANKYEHHQDEFEHPSEFEAFRENIGNLVLLPRGTNQSYGDLPYHEKRPHYIRENLLVKSLCPEAYDRNPNFLNMIKELDLPFEPHQDLKKVDIEKRQNLYQAICERIWAFEPQPITEP
ncbi:MAG: DUF262 domain-containing protein [Roseibacillus sp.]